MKRTILYLCVALFVLFVIQPNIGSATPKTNRTPDRDATVVRTNEDLIGRECKSHATIAVDAARGGDDVGYNQNGQIPEKDLNLAIGKALGNELEKAGYKVIYTRDSDSFGTYDTRDAEGEARVEKAKAEKADYLISVQLSSDTNPLTGGFCLFTQQDDKMIRCAEEIADGLSALNFSQFQGIDSDHYANFPILRDRTIPCMALDLGYCSNPDEYTRLSDAAFQQKIAAVVARSFLNTIN